MTRCHSALEEGAVTERLRERDSGGEGRGFRWDLGGTSSQHEQIGTESRDEGRRHVRAAEKDHNTAAAVRRQV